MVNSWCTVRETLSYDAYYLTGEDLASHPTRTLTSTSCRLSTTTACLYATTLQNLEAVPSIHNASKRHEAVTKDPLNNVFFSHTLIARLYDLVLLPMVKGD